MKTQEELKDQLERATRVWSKSSGHRWIEPFSEGVTHTLKWILGEEAEPPFEDPVDEDGEEGGGYAF